jgi:hypothetical protein
MLYPTFPGSLIMTITNLASITPFHHVAASAAPAPKVPVMTEERLPFLVKLAHTHAELEKAVQIRHAAYGRHLPQFAETLKLPEPSDLEEGAAVLLAQSKLDGSPLGTMRIQTNRFKPLPLEQSIVLPSQLRERPLAEATRLGVTDGRTGRLVTTVLFKAFFLYCQRHGIEWMVIAGRSPVDRQYDRLLFEDVYPGMGYVPLQHASNLPHRILSFEVSTAQARWTAANHPLYNFVFGTLHADIDVSGHAPLVQHFHAAHTAAVAGMRM